MILSTAYFPPVSWFALLLRDSTLSPDRVFCPPVLLEAHESYVKQTWRNRCLVLGPNGVEMLQVPVAHSASMAIREVRVDYSTPWVMRTIRALDTNYESSPYYYYYKDGFADILGSRIPLLWDLNLALAEHCLTLLGLPCPLVPTDGFTAPGILADDHRYTLSPKLPDTVLADMGLQRPWYQVFSNKFGFTPGLSILDLLFNEGPSAVSFLMGKIDPEK